MRTHQQWLEYQALELISAPSPRRNISLRGLLTLVRAIAENVLQSIVLPKSEPLISHIVDRFGQSCWLVYDPITTQTYQMGSEDEVRCWLEQRFSGLHPSQSSSSMTHRGLGEFYRF